MSTLVALKRFRGVMAFLSIGILLLSVFPLAGEIKPVKAEGHTVTKIWAMMFGGFASMSDGTLWVWGDINELAYGDPQPKLVNGIQDVEQVAGYGKSYALKKDGTLWALGRTPAQVQGISQVAKIAVGDNFTLALKKDGTVWAWGNNVYGQLGIGNKEPRETPTQVSGLNQVKDIANGMDHALALREDGTVWGWGTNFYGELGDATSEIRLAPAQIKNLTGIKQIAAASSQSFAVKEDGTVWGWGYNGSDKLLGGDETFQTQPTQIKGLPPIAQISAGNYHTLALSDKGDVYNWGDPLSVIHYGYSEGTGPYKVDQLSNIVSIQAGEGFSLAMTKEGAIWGWGKNEKGQLGNGEKSDVYPDATRSLLGAGPQVNWSFKSEPDHQYGPIEIPLNTRVEPSSINYDNIELMDSRGLKVHFELEATDMQITLYPKVRLIVGEAYVVRIEGLKALWGQEMEKPFEVIFSPSLGASPLAHESLLSAGANHSILRDSIGYLLAWGDNSKGQLGDGTTLQRSVPVPIDLPKRMITVAAGGSHTLALDEEGKVWSWGDNSSGQLGNTQELLSSTPHVIEELNEIIAISAGEEHSLALKKDGTVWSWGGTPSQVPLLKDVIAISAGAYYNLALKQDGTVWAWGSNAAGQLGTGDKVDSSVPTQVKGLINVHDISAGWSHSAAVLEDGTVWGWGSNEVGQLAQDTMNESLEPVRIPGLSEVKALDAGEDFTLALKKDGSLWAWGLNDLNQLGNGSDVEFQTKPVPIPIPNAIPNLDPDPNTTPSTTPSTTPIQGMKHPKIAAFAAGGAHALAQTEKVEVRDNAIVYQKQWLYGWGYNFSGQVGDGSMYHRPEPSESALTNQEVFYRLAGQNRNETAIEVSNQGWSYGASTVVLARNDDFPDALSGAPLAHGLNAPILLTDSKTLSPETRTEIERLAPRYIVLLGSEGALSREIEEELGKKYEVIRLGGTDRYETSAQIAEYMKERELIQEPKAVLAYGENFPDALAVSSFAAYQEIPILLTPHDELPNAVQDSLAQLKVKQTVIVGGTGVVSEKVASQVPQPIRYAGQDRYETALEIVQNMGADLKQVYIATGENYPDALTGSALAARTNSPILLVNQNLPDKFSTPFEKQENRRRSIFILGGKGVVSEEIKTQLEEMFLTVSGPERNRLAP